MACVQSNYEVNVAQWLKPEASQDGKPRLVHYCTIELGSMLSGKAHTRFGELCGIFGRQRRADGKAEFELTLRYWECRGQELLRS